MFFDSVYMGFDMCVLPNPCAGGVHSVIEMKAPSQSGLSHPAAFLLCSVRIASPFPTPLHTYVPASPCPALLCLLQSACGIFRFWIKIFGLSRSSIYRTGNLKLKNKTFSFDCLDRRKEQVSIFRITAATNIEGH